MTEVLILLGWFTVLCMIGMPVAYTLGLAAIIGSLWIDVPLEAVMIQISSGVSGSSVADTASIGSVLIPQMVKQGYPKVFATNVTICGSVQAVLIPPSHNAVLYSLAVGGTISVAQLFLAGFLPGLLFGACVIMAPCAPRLPP